MKYGKLSLNMTKKLHIETISSCARGRDNWNGTCGVLPCEGLGKGQEEETTKGDFRRKIVLQEDAQE
jgi:hypothetical protein